MCLLTWPDVSGTVRHVTQQSRRSTRPRLDVRIAPRLAEQIQAVSDRVEILPARITRTAVARELARRMELADRSEGKTETKYALCEGCWEWLDRDDSGEFIPHQHRGRTYKGEA